MPIFDGHNDVLLSIHGYRGEPRSFFDRGEIGHLDLPRAREGGFAGGLFAIWAEQHPAARVGRTHPPGSDHVKPLALQVEQPHALSMAVSLAATLHRMVTESKGQIRLVTTIAELKDCISSGVLAAVMHFEGAEPIDAELNALDVFYAAGLRSVGLVWSRPNAFGTGVPFGHPASPDTGPGLTDAGFELVRACNELGIVVDVSHLNEKGFWDVARTSRTPIVATHSNAHAVTPSTRNLTDKQLDAIRDSGGIVGVNFSVAFSRPDGVSPGTGSGTWDPKTPMSMVVRHFKYLSERMGVDHVGFGSDFDGTVVPGEIRDAAGLPKLVAALAEGGFSQDDLKKITHTNWMRVLEANWNSRHR